MNMTVFRGNEPAVRFGAAPKAAATSEIFQKAQALQVQLANQREAIAPNQVKRNGPGLFKKLFFAMFALTSVGTLGAGATRVYTYHSSQPRGEQVQVEAEMNRFHRYLGDQYEDLNEWAREAQANKKGYNYSTTTLAEFQTRAKKFFDTFAQTLAESPDPADQALAKKLTLSTQESEARIDKLGNALYLYVQGQMAKGQALQLNTFLENQPAVAHLTPREKEAMAADLFAIFNASPTLEMSKFQLQAVQAERSRPGANSQNASSERRLREVLGVYLGNGVNGLTMEQFLATQSPEEAAQLFEGVLQKNYSHLDPADQQLLMNRSKAMLQVLSYQFKDPGLFYALLAYGLAGVGLLGTRITTRRIAASVKQALAARPDPTALKLQIIQHWGRSQNEADLATLKSKLKTSAEKRQQAAALYPEFQEALKTIYPNFGRSTRADADQLGSLYETLAHQQLMQRAKTDQTVPEIQFQQTVLKLVEAAEQRGDALPEFALAEAQVDRELAALAKAPAGKDAQQHLLAKEQLVLQKKQLQTTGRLLNLLIQATPAQEVLTQQEADLAALKHQRATAAAGEQERLDHQIQLAEKRVQAARTTLQTHQLILDEHRAYQATLAEQQLSLELLQVEQSDNKAFAAKLAELEALQRAHGRHRENPEVAALKQRIRTQGHAKAAVLDELTAQQQVRQAIEAKLKEVGGSGESTTPPEA